MVFFSAKKDLLQSKKQRVAAARRRHKDYNLAVLVLMNPSLPVHSVYNGAAERV